MEVRLNCRRDYRPGKTASWCELSGFEVVGAARQWGTVAVAADGDWQVLFGPAKETRPLDPLPEALRKEDVIAGLEYFSQPYSLPVQLAPRKSRVAVEPEYVLLVDQDQVRLEGKLRYTIRGANASALELAMPGWELDEVGPDSLVAVDDVTPGSGTISIPLVRPSKGRITLELRAHRVIKPGATSLLVALPRPQADSATPARVAVVAADNVELTPNDGKIEGLVRQRAAPPMALPARQQQPLYYRGTGGAATFAAGLRIQPQRIAVDAASHVTLGTPCGSRTKVLLCNRP